MKISTGGRIHRAAGHILGMMSKTIVLIFIFLVSPASAELPEKAENKTTIISLLYPLPGSRGPT